MSATLFDKIWQRHVIADLHDGWALLHIDRHLLHELSGTPALMQLRKQGIAVRNPELACATPDHTVSTAPGRTGLTFQPGAQLWQGLRQLAALNGIRLFDLDQDGQGIVHVIGPEQGITQPGATLVCGDSHTCTNGGVGALAFGIGSSEIAHVLATQTLRQQKPRQMRIRFDGQPAPGVTPKDLILHAIASLGAASGTGYAVEFAGPAIDAMEIEGRMTVCNLAVEMGAKYGMVAPDEKTYAYLQGRPLFPRGELLRQALADWRTLPSDAGAHFDVEHVIDAGAVAPTITWGTSPEQALAVTASTPRPDAAPDDATAQAWREALTYMGLEPGAPLLGTPIDWVFIGSCANSRLSDLRAAAAVLRHAPGRRVASHVTAWVVPGSVQVKRAAEAEGLDALFVAAGFAWREPGCGMCVAANGERVPPGARAVSTSNRNFVARQGPGARTHLASPAMAAAAALAGAIVDVRTSL